MTLQYDLQLSVDRKRFRTFAARVVPVLEQVALTKGEVIFEGVDLGFVESFEDDEARPLPSPDENLFSYLGGVGEGFVSQTDRRLRSGSFAFYGMYATVWCGVQEWKARELSLIHI